MNILFWLLPLLLLGILAIYWHKCDEAAELRESNEQLRQANRDAIQPLFQPSPPRSFRIPPQTIDWTPDNVQILRRFYSDETGRKLLEICGGHALHEALKECAGDKGAPQAAGMDAMLRFQFNLASDATLQTISGASAESDANTADREQEAAAPVEIRRSF